jgi:endonuclease G
MVATGSAQLADYKNSGFDRGHLFPAGDAWDSSSMNDCFYLSNMSPQIHAFNAGIWEKLETQVRNWALTLDTLYIVTAGILKDSLPTIGANSVAVPAFFYKAILCKNKSDISGIGFILSSVNSSQPLKSFAVPIDSIESVTGIDFFPQLPDSIENSVESKIDTLKWFSATKVITNRYSSAGRKKSVGQTQNVNFSGRKIANPAKKKAKSSVYLKKSVDGISEVITTLSKD